MYVVEWLLKPNPYPKIRIPEKIVKKFISGILLKKRKLGGGEQRAKLSEALLFHIQGGGN